MSDDIWVKDGQVYIKNLIGGSAFACHALVSDVAQAIHDTQMGEGCPICGRTEPHEHEIEGPGDTGIETPIDLDKGPKFGSWMKAGHYSITFGHEPDGPVLFETDRKDQAHLLHMALANAHTDDGLVETLHSCVNRHKCDEIYGEFSNRPHRVVWMPETEFDKIIKVLTKADEHGLAAIMRQGYLDWRKGRPEG